MKVLLTTLLFLFAAFHQDAAVAGQPASRTYQDANRLFAKSQYEAALRAYQKALVDSSNAVSRGDIQSRIGDCYFRLQDYQKALESYRIALQNQNQAQRPPTQYWIGFCAFLLGRDAEAETEFLKIPELYPKSGMWVGTAWYWAGRAAERLGGKERATKHYRKAGGTGTSKQEKFAMKRAEKAKGENVGR
jgi:tetratricopeptide (TPR) repeat protein